MPGPRRPDVDIMQAIARMEAELPRGAETTDEQHRHDAFVEISRRHLGERTDLPTSTARGDLASVAMASIRDAEENAR